MEEGGDVASNAIIIRTTVIVIRAIGWGSYTGLTE